jgi:hypothetical protein
MLVEVVELVVQEMKLKYVVDTVMVRAGGGGGDARVLTGEHLGVDGD